MIIINDVYHDEIQSQGCWDAEMKSNVSRTSMMHIIGIK